MAKRYNEDVENSDVKSLKGKKYKGKKGGSSKKSPPNDSRSDRLYVDTNNRREKNDKWEEGKDSSRSRTNDVRWYAQNPELLRDSASIPFSWPVGKPLSLGNANFNPTNPQFSDYVLPGVCTLAVTLCPGISTDNNSAVNIAARNIYSFVRHANSGSSMYDSPDLMLYLLAMGELYAMFYHGCRAYGTMQLFNQQNRYYPKSIVQALGFDYEDLASNLAQFRYYLNSIAIRIGSLCVPKSMPILDRHKWIYSGLYTDGTSAKAQTYAYVPAGYRVFDGTGSTGGALNFVSLKYNVETPTFTVATFIETLDSMINPIIGDESMNIMSGDILKAYGPEGMYKLDAISDMYVVVPMYDEEVLTQFQNASILGTGATNLNVTQDPNIGKGTIIFQPSWNSTSTTDLPDVRTSDKLFTLNNNVGTPALAMVGSRLSNILVPGDNTNSLTIQHSGTELCLGAYLWYYGNDGSGNVDLHATTINRMFVGDVGAPEVLSAYLNAVALISRFKFHPLVSLSLRNPEGKIAGVYHHMEVDNFALLDEYTLGCMHDTAVLSEFNCPQMGSFNTKTS